MAPSKQAQLLAKRRPRRRLLPRRLLPPSKIKIIGVPLLAAAVLLAIFAVLLRGADPRSSDENP